MLNVSSISVGYHLYRTPGLLYQHRSGEMELIRGFVPLLWTVIVFEILCDPDRTPMVSDYRMETILVLPEISGDEQDVNGSLRPSLRHFSSVPHCISFSFRRSQRDRLVPSFLSLLSNVDADRL